MHFLTIFNFFRLSKKLTHLLCSTEGGERCWWCHVCVVLIATKEIPLEYKLQFYQLILIEKSSADDIYTPNQWMYLLQFSTDTCNSSASLSRH